MRESRQHPWSQRCGELGEEGGEENNQMKDQEEKAWNITRAVWRTRFREGQSRQCSAMVWVRRVMVMVGMKAALVAGPRIPGKLSVAPLNFHWPYEVMMSDKENKEPKRKKKQKRKITQTKQTKRIENKCIYFWDRVSCSIGWPGASYIHQLLMLLLCPPKWWD